MRMLRHVALAAIALSSGGVAASAAPAVPIEAQTNPASPKPGMDMAGMKGDGGMGQMMPMMRGMMGMIAADHVEGRIAYRKAELGITDAQLPQWDALATVLRANARVMQDGMAKMMKDGMPTTAPARGEAMVLMMTERLEGMKALVQADEALYAVLSTEQRKSADELMTGPMGAM